MSNVFNITINDSLHSLDLSSSETAWISPDTSLATFIRTKTNYRGTKVSCAEGGCGACTVALTKFDASIGAVKTRPVNACLAKLLSLNGASVVTNDFIGNKVVGYHPIQEKLAELNGTQCGYCASGMVMLLYCFLKENPNATPLEVERCLDGNLCRCTGYRPILDTFKSFATNSNGIDFTEEKACRKANCCQKQQKHLFDLEECHKAADVAPPHNRIMKVHHSKNPLKSSHLVPFAAPPPSYHAATTAVEKTRLAATTAIWQDCNTLPELSYWMQHYSDLQVMLAVGSTSLAIFPMEYDVYLNIGAIPELNVLSQSETGITVGACNPVKNVIDFVSSVSTAVAYQTQNFPAVVSHLNRLAGYSLRCRASIGGNLMITRQHQQPLDFFPSDAALVMLGLNATVSVLDVASGVTSVVSMANFFSMDFTQRVLVSIFIPFATNEFQKFGSYKIAKRQVMSHAFVNCAFQATVSPLSHTISNPIVAIGGIYTCPTRISAIETALTGVDVTSLAAVQTVCSQLYTILEQNVAPQGGRQQFRVQTAVNYLYKFILSLQPDVPSNLSKATCNWLVRGVTSASQTFGTDPQQYPVSQPLNKVDGLTQTSGEAQYTADLPAPHGLLHAAIVQTTVANATISFVDTSAANSVEGFVKYYDATSIPSSRNTFGVAPIFTTGVSNYAGQCVGFVVAKSRDIALKCAALIQGTIEYTNQQTPILTVQQAVAANTAFPGVVVPPVTQGDVTTGFAQSAKVVSGSVQIGSQYHIHLENNAAIVQPVEGMYQVIAASQAPVCVQNVVANVIGVPSALVQVATRRCGGAFGAKQTNSNFITAVAAIAAQDLQLPVSLELTLQDPLRGLGARPLYLYNYKMGVDANNKIIAFDGACSLSCGYTSPDCYAEATTCVGNLDNCYNIPNFNVTLTIYQTNIAPGTSVRGPGWIQAIVLMEMCLSDAARQLGIDGTVLRQGNFYQKGNTLPTGMPLVECNLERVWSTLQASSELQTRQAAVATFNAENKFVKRGLSINPCRFGVDWSWPNYNASVAIYSDGSIAISHGGVEVGQGINTKISQVCAFKLGLTAADMPNIRVLTTSTRCGPSMTNVTGGSVTSELCSLAVIHCCEILMQRLQPFLTQSSNNWAAAVSAASNANVDLFASSCSAQPMPPYSRYNTWGASVSEVEVDALTGQFEVKRTDLVYDCGISLNPYVDIGQVEGGFTFGLGWFTVESVEWDAFTGQALDASTWEYKPPTAYEIPETFNVTLLENAFNTSGVLSSKASGEPPVALSVSVVQALEAAINAARSDNSLSPITVTSLPLPVDTIANMCGVTVQNYQL